MANKPKLPTIKIPKQKLSPREKIIARASDPKVKKSIEQLIKNSFSLRFK